MKDLHKKLSAPFPAEDIEWRVQNCGVNKKGGPFAIVLAYLESRAIMSRLDEVCGPSGWKTTQPIFVSGPITKEEKSAYIVSQILTSASNLVAEAKKAKQAPPTGDLNKLAELAHKFDGLGRRDQHHSGFMFGISIKIKDEWITKWDGAHCTEVEAIKGGISGAWKRAAVPWGIGRYLYSLEKQWAECSFDRAPGYSEQSWGGGRDIYWKKPTLPVWALPEQPPAAPIDLTETKMNLEAAAKEGLEVLHEMWKKLPGELRDAVFRQDAMWWDGLKEKAREVQEVTS